MIKKRSSKKIPAHFGMNDYYKFFCKNNPNLNIDKSTYNLIISKYNKFVAEYLIDELDIILPFKLGKIEILKKKRKVYLNDEGKIINTLPIDWKATNNLWLKDKEAKDNKILIRLKNTHTNGYVFRIYYNKKNAYYKNNKLYFFKPIRGLSRSIASRIKDYSKEKYDTFIKK